MDAITTHLWKYFSKIRVYYLHVVIACFLARTVYQLEKVDTEKIFQLNNFSKVDNSDNFV